MGRSLPAATGRVRPVDIADWPPLKPIRCSCARRRNGYGFVEGEDYLIDKTINQVPHQGGTRNATVIDYHLSLDIAKADGYLYARAPGMVTKTAPWARSRLCCAADRKKMPVKSAHPDDHVFGRLTSLFRLRVDAVTECRHYCQAIIGTVKHACLGQHIFNIVDIETLNRA